MAYDPYYALKTTFGVGARVKVIRQRKYPEYKLLDLIGTVRTDSGGNVSVIFDTITNTRSQYGCFYFKAVDLVEAEDKDIFVEEDNMNDIKITNYLNVVEGTYVNEPGSMRFAFANFDPGVEVGDLVVTSDRGVFKLAKVEKILKGVDLELRREVVVKVHRVEYDERVRVRQQAAELKARMQERAKQLQDIALYEMLAKDDPDMKALLCEYRSLPVI